MRIKSGNYAFIDAQNLHRGIKSLGWKLDWERFRVYLNEKYGVDVAYIFIGYLPENKELYVYLQKAGYVLVYKPVIPNGEGGAKGNVDADLVLQVMLDFNRYKKAVIISSDGDFYSLIKHLYDKDKLELVISPYKKTCSVLLRKSAREKIVFINNLEKLLGKKKSTA
ncbi:hypothetical protein A3I25_02360 [Candidatus Nomurabacteria bacterium RIFCSPLOWO2_02_FULL_42_17]|uniref:NYN domain-containing protein n=1 Tax=Candidatus Nomurabacteria bacterium RIFCSPLOWO2_02_FULL_42_17 TaxID=1801789 RepID=A0A1F6XTC4_9BACT|nr:MAG: hypothetical protein A3I25_02360 [Candidatus Nomurabacteria bacterium RIFCSPLOWO2_02_FULL_42_17]